MANPSSKAKTSEKKIKSAPTIHESVRVSKYPPSRKAGLKPFTPETAREAQKKSTLTKQALAAKRKQIREDILASMPEDARQDLWKAVRCGDVDKVKCYETVFRIVGSTFDQSEERVQNFKVNQNTQEKRSVVINFRKATPEDAK